MKKIVESNPMPRTDVEKFLAMSDYLASRKKIKLDKRG
jgi:hypothetical protein